MFVLPLICCELLANPATSVTGGIDLDKSLRVGKSQLFERKIRLIISTLRNFMCNKEGNMDEVFSPMLRAQVSKFILFLNNIFPQNRNI